MRARSSGVVNRSPAPRHCWTAAEHPARLKMKVIAGSRPSRSSCSMTCGRLGTHIRRGRGPPRPRPPPRPPPRAPPPAFDPRLGLGQLDEFTVEQRLVAVIGPVGVVGVVGVVPLAHG